jgi:sarcosine oxidase / L-pipecolate oxidase
MIGGSIPPNSNPQLKFWRDVSFMNTVHHAASEQDISMPPDQADYCQWEVMSGLKKDIQGVSKSGFGEKCRDLVLHH